MIRKFWALFQNFAVDPTLYKESRSGFYTSLRALKYSLRGGYKPDEFKDGGYVSLRQLEKEQANLLKSVANFKFTNVETIYFPISKRLSLLCFITFLLPFSVLSRRVAYSLTSLVIYVRLTHDRREKIFTYYGFVEEVKNCLWLCRQNKEPIDYFELANFFDDTMLVNARRLHVMFDLGAKYIEGSTRINVENVVYKIPSEAVLSKASDLPNKSKKVGFFASGYYARQRHQSHDEAFLKAAESGEASVIMSLAQASKNEGWNFVICPHYARNVETYQDAFDYYSAVLGSEFDVGKILATGPCHPREFNLSTTFGSNVFFDAFGQGLKVSVIDGPDVYEKFLCSAKMTDFRISQDMIKRGWVSDVLKQTDKTFLAERIGD